jgi:phosphotransferase system HPr-like phosphotransfer protein
LDLLRECVDNERRRLEAKKMLKLLALKIKKEGGNSILHPGARREAARSIFERLISSTDVNRDQAEEQDNGSFQ